MATWNERAASFDRIPEQYDRMRPNYPAALYDDLLAHVPPDGTVLEIGCGPGKFTEPMAARGYPIECVEPGPALAQYAADRLRPYGRVKVFNTSFEAFDTPNHYGLLVAASAFQWLDANTRFQRCHALLQPDGLLAICGIGPCRGPESQGFWTLAQPIFAEVVPTAIWHGALPNKRPGKFRWGKSPWFDAVLRRIYPWQQQYTGHDYIQLLDTYSEFQTLPPETKAILHRRLIELIESRFDNQVVQYYESSLDLRRRR